MPRIVTKKQPPIVGKSNCLMCDRPLPVSKTKPRRFCPDGPGVACRQGFQRLKAEAGTTLVICRNRSGTFRVRPGELNASLIFTPTSGGPEQFVRGYEIEFPRAPLADRKHRRSSPILDKYGNGTMGGVDGRIHYYTKRTKGGTRVRFRDWTKVIQAREACHLARARRFEYRLKVKGDL
jgi:hypothetical protein